MEAIQTQDLTKHYRSGVFKRKNIPALEKVSLSVEQGEIFGLLGPNGAGKTTFVKLILSIVHPTSGTATVSWLSFRKAGIKRVLRIFTRKPPISRISYCGKYIGIFWKIKRIAGIDI
jgi:ABC-type multidrug transport system ATPase subunit